MTPHIMSKTAAALFQSPSPPQFPTERKLKKPLMEKRRRARMNECLEQLKQLLLQISPNHRNKLEKADILEMTVAYLNQLHQTQMPTTSSPYDQNNIYRRAYTEGFMLAASACLAYFRGIELGAHTQHLCQGLMQHLQAMMPSVQKVPGASGQVTGQQFAPPPLSVISPTQSATTRASSSVTVVPGAQSPVFSPYLASCSGQVLHPFCPNSATVHSANPLIPCGHLKAANSHSSLPNVVVPALPSSSPLPPPLPPPPPPFLRDAHQAKLEKLANDSNLTRLGSTIVCHRTVGASNKEANEDSRVDQRRDRLSPLAFSAPRLKRSTSADHSSNFKVWRPF